MGQSLGNIMLGNPFFGVGVDVRPHRYTTRHYALELARISRIFKEKFAEISEDLPEDHGDEDSPEDEDGGTNPRKTLAAQRSQAMGAASKRLSRSVALRFILACKEAGFPMSVHLATRLLVNLFVGYGRSGISESTLVEFAGGGPEARQNKKLDLEDVHRKIAESGLIERHRRLLDSAKNEAQAIRAGINRE